MTNFAAEFADGVRIEKFYNYLFNDNNNSGLKASTDVQVRAENWRKLNKDLFEKDLSRRVYLDEDSIAQLSSGKD